MLALLELLELQEALGLPQLRMLKMVVTRWFSRSGVASADRVYADFQALVEQFSIDESDYPKQLEILMTSKRFVTLACLPCFAGLLAELAHLNRKFCERTTIPLVLTQ